MKRNAIEVYVANHYSLIALKRAFTCIQVYSGFGENSDGENLIYHQFGR